MKLPRDLSGAEPASRLRLFGFVITRPSGSHLRLTSTTKGFEHHIPIPAHAQIRGGTLRAILQDVAAYPETDRTKLAEVLFAP